MTFVVADKGLTKEVLEQYKKNILLVRDIDVKKYLEQFMNKPIYTGIWPFRKKIVLTTYEEAKKYERIYIDSWKLYYRENEFSAQVSTIDRLLSALKFAQLDDDMEPIWYLSSEDAKILDVWVQYWEKHSSEYENI